MIQIAFGILGGFFLICASLLALWLAMYCLLGIVYVLGCVFAGIVEFLIKPKNAIIVGGITALVLYICLT